MFWASFYFFDAVQSAQFVDPQVVHLKTDCHRFCPQSKAGSTPLARVKPMWPRPRSLPQVRLNKGSLREKSPDRLPPPSVWYLRRLWFFRHEATVDKGFLLPSQSTCATPVTRSCLLPNDVIEANTLMG